MVSRPSLNPFNTDKRRTRSSSKLDIASSHHRVPSGASRHPPNIRSRIPLPERIFFSSTHRSADIPHPAKASANPGGTVTRPRLKQTSFIATQCKVSPGASDQSELNSEAEAFNTGLGVDVPETSAEAGVCRRGKGMLLDTDDDDAS